MKQPFIRVTKWLTDIPVEATCTFCRDVVFQVQPTSHRPVREEYQKSLQRQFDEHCRLTHPGQRHRDGKPEY